MPPFKGLTPEAFEAYTQDKWSSNVHNLARMRVKDTMVALCDAAATKLGGELEGLSRAASDEVPNIINHKKVDAQWLYWARDAAARKALAVFLEKTPLDVAKLFDIAPQDKHITLAVVLLEDGLWVGLRIAPGATVDRRNLSAMLEKPWEREQLLELLKDLPEGAEMGSKGQLIPAGSATLETLSDLADGLGPDKPAFQLGHSIAAAEAIELGADLADHISRWLGALSRHYRFIAWVAGNDHIGANRQLQEEKAEKRRQALGHKAGDKVRIISGMFKGKVGMVQSIDAKAQVKVRVGKMSVVLAGSDLTSA